MRWWDSTHPHTLSPAHFCWCVWTRHAITAVAFATTTLQVSIFGGKNSYITRTAHTRPPCDTTNILREKNSHPVSPPLTHIHTIALWHLSHDGECTHISIRACMGLVVHMLWLLLLIPYSHHITTYPLTRCSPFNCVSVCVWAWMNEFVVHTHRRRRCPRQHSHPFLCVCSRLM